MIQQEKDLCKTCNNYWEDFIISPVKQFIPHCSIIDRKYGFKNMDEVVSHPCVECSFNSYIKK